MFEEMPEMHFGGMFKEMNEHFKMMDQLMGKINHREDWARLQPQDWQIMLPHSVRFQAPQMQSEWEEDMETSVLLQGME